MQPGGLLHAAQQDEPKRFTTRKNPLKFYVDDELFTGVPALPAESAMDLTDMHAELQAAQGKDKLKVVMRVFSEFLEDESLERFTRRLSDKSNPIDLGTLLDVIRWVIGEGYGLRPTQRPSPSDTGSDGSGTNSTDGALLGVLTPESSSGVASST